MLAVNQEQNDVCARYGASFEQPQAGSHLGIALETLHLVPVYGVRVSPEHGTNGWYIWGGEWSAAADFFQPLCVEHLADRCPLALPFLALAPGWRFITDGSYADVWYDPTGFPGT